MKLGIIGPGLVWQKKHNLALKELTTTFEVVAFCASSERRRVETLREYSNASFDTDLAQFLGRKSIDAVAVLTPIHLSASIAIAAMEAGKTVFLEKPIAHGEEAGREVLSASRRTGAKIWILEQAVYEPQIQTIKAILDAGEIGKLVYFDQVFHWPLDTGLNDRGGYGKTKWRIEPSFPLGSLFDGGHHQIAVLSTLFGTPISLYASGAKLREGFGDFDHVVVQLGYENGCRGVLSHSSSLGATQNTFTIWGTGGSITMQNKQVIVELDGGLRRQIDFASEDAHRIMWRALQNCVLEGRIQTYSLTQAFDDLKTLCAIEKSLKSGAFVTL